MRKWMMCTIFLFLFLYRLNLAVTAFIQETESLCVRVYVCVSLYPICLFFRRTIFDTSPKKYFTYTTQVHKYAHRRYTLGHSTRHRNAAAESIPAQLCPGAEKVCKRVFCKGISWYANDADTKRTYVFFLSFLV